MKQENKSTQKIKMIAVMAAVVLTLSSALAFGGCSDKKAGDTSATKPTTAPNVAATVAQKATQAKTDSAPAQDVQSNDNQDDSQSGDGGSASSHGIFDVWYAGISEQDAGMKALDQFSSNSVINSRETGTYDGAECWIIYVTDNSAGKTYICYVSDDFCNVEESGSYTIDDNYYADITEQAAGQKAVQACGGSDTSGIKILSSNAGYYQGQEAWVVHLSRADGTETIAYVGGDFCYFQ